MNAPSSSTVPTLIHSAPHAASWMISAAIDSATATDRSALRRTAGDKRKSIDTSTTPGGWREKRRGGSHLGRLRLVPIRDPSIRLHGASGDVFQQCRSVCRWGYSAGRVTPNLGTVQLLSKLFRGFLEFGGCAVRFEHLEQCTTGIGLLEVGSHLLVIAIPLRCSKSPTDDLRKGHWVASLLRDIFPSGAVAR